MTFRRTGARRAVGAAAAGMLLGADENAEAALAFERKDGSAGFGSDTPGRAEESPLNERGDPLPAWAAPGKRRPAPAVPTLESDALAAGSGVGART